MYSKKSFIMVFLIILSLLLITSCQPPTTPASYTITATAGAGGSISPSGLVIVTEGENQTFTITPNEGYQIADVLVDDESVGAVTTYIFQSILQDHTIQTSFVQQSQSPVPPVSITYAITANAGTGGSIDPEGSVKVNKGNDRIFTINPFTCYQIADVLVDGASIGAETSYTFQNVQQDHSIQASFIVSGIGVHNIDIGVGYNTIQEAIDAAIDGETIIVCMGTYHENIKFDGRNITVRSTDPLNPTVVATTIIDGGSGSVVEFTGGDASTLEGFTIRNGNADYGGGIHVHGGSSPTITGNIITGNTANDNGAGIYVDEISSPTISNNAITSNHANATSGGGITVHGGSSPVITGNIITGNMAQAGGGIFVYDNSSPTISENVITGHTVGYSGGGIYVSGGSPIITSNTITGNAADENGGGIYVGGLGGSTPNITGNIINSNTAENFGGGIFVGLDSDLLPDDTRPTGWGTGRENIPIGDPLVPAEGVKYTIAGNEFLGNEHANPLDYTEGAHVYFDD